MAAVLAAAAAAGLEVETLRRLQAGILPRCRVGTLCGSFSTNAGSWGPRNDLVTPVLILDQFEEVFTLGRQSPHTSDFLEQLADLAENRMPVHRPKPP